MRRNIEFLNNLSIENEDSFEYILKNVSTVNKGDIIHIYFSDIDKLDSKSLPLLILLTYLLSKVVSQSIYIVANQEIIDYLFSIGFFRLCYVSTKNLKRNTRKYEHVVIPIKKFVGIRGRNDLLQLARIQLSEHKEIMEDVFRVLHNLSDNCLEHTSQDPENIECIAFVERTDNLVKVVIMDFGEGFYESFQRCQNICDVQGEEQILLSVLEQHCSSKGDMGAGIWTIEDMVNERRGKLLIITGNSSVHYGKGLVQRFKRVPFVIGSIIYVEIEENRARELDK